MRGWASRRPSFLSDWRRLPAMTFAQNQKLVRYLAVIYYLPVHCSNLKFSCQQLRTDAIFYAKLPRMLWPQQSHSAFMMLFAQMLLAAYVP